jgi:hypothetical protein
MTRYVHFKRFYGAPDASSADRDFESRIGDCTDLADFSKEIGFGSFQKGFLTVGSRRETLPGSDSWLKDLPANAYAFATTCFGLQLLLCEDRVAIVDPLLGSILHSTLSVREALCRMANRTSLEGFLGHRIFATWHERVGHDLPPHQLLIPRPLPVLGGQVTWDSLTETDAATFFSITRQSFDGRYGEIAHHLFEE